MLFMREQKQWICADLLILCRVYPMSKLRQMTVEGVVPQFSEA